MRERLCFARRRPKRRYRTKDDAEQARQWLIEHRRGDTTRLTVFPCKDCGCFHVGNRKRKKSA